MAANTPEESLTKVDLSDWYHRVVTFLGEELTRNTFANYLTALAIASAGCLAIWSVKGILARYAANRLSGGGSRVDPALAVRTATAMIPLLYLFPLYSALATLSFSATVTRLISFLFLLFFTTRAITFLSSLALLVTDMYLRSRRESIHSASGKALTPIIRMIFWALGLTFLLDNLGFQISSIIAGLGIAGVAVGLAGQAILGDFFGYLVILLDEPFTIGDEITVGSRTGRVESIGLKTTRLRMSSGETLVCPNGDLTKQAVVNALGVTYRSATLRFTLAPDTPQDILAAIPGMVRDRAAGLRDMTLTRIHLADMGELGPEFEVAFQVPGTSTAPLFAARERCLLLVAEAVREKGARFARRTAAFASENTEP